MKKNEEKQKSKPSTKRLFLTKGTCSNTFFYLLNQEFGHTIEVEEKASDPLAGGILLQGYQCGMLWGSALAVGAESYRRCNDQGEAIGMAVTAAQDIVKSFTTRTNTVECSDITSTDWTSKLSMAKYAFTGKFMTCFNLSENWAPEAIQAAKDGLKRGQANSKKACASCASMVIKKMGGSDEEVVTVAGLAGGLGLSGNGCGALAAAIWFRNIQLLKNDPKKNFSLKNPELEEILKVFHQVTDYEMLCQDITGRTFNTVEEHSKFIKDGGCEKIINALAAS